MGSLERVVSRLSPSPSQTASYPQYQTSVQDTQLYSQSSQAQPYLYQAPQAQPTSYSNGSTTQTSYPTSTATPELSAETAAVVNHFGLEAPGILNQYAVTLEDALMSQQQTLDSVANRAAVMEHILTDPEQLADYTDRFFTEVYPMETVYDQAAASYPENNGYGYEPRYDQMPAVPAGAIQNAPTNTELQWEGFSETMNRSPEQAWRYLSQMNPESFRSKLLFMDAS